MSELKAVGIRIAAETMLGDPALESLRNACVALFCLCAISFKLNVGRYRLRGEALHEEGLRKDQSRAEESPLGAVDDEDGVEIILAPWFQVSSSNAPILRDPSVYLFVSSDPTRICERSAVRGDGRRWRLSRGWFESVLTSNCKGQ